MDKAKQKFKILSPVQLGKKVFYPIDPKTGKQTVCVFGKDIDGDGIADLIACRAIEPIDQAELDAFEEQKEAERVAAEKAIAQENVDTATELVSKAESDLAAAEAAKVPADIKEAKKSLADAKKIFDTTTKKLASFE